MKNLSLTAEEVLEVNRILSYFTKIKLSKVINVHRYRSSRYTSFYKWHSNINWNELGFKWAAGQTKIVFLSDNLPNWVIKIPFLFPADCRVGTKDAKDYCSLEAEVYRNAKKAEVDNYFAPCFLYKKVHGVPVYLQQRVDFNENENEEVFFNHCASNYSRDEFDTEDEYYSAVNSDADYLDDDERIHAIFGYRDGERLLDFLDEYAISDIHSGNFGFYKECPKLIDYSGY